MIPERSITENIVHNGLLEGETEELIGFCKVDFKSIWQYINDS